TVSRACSRKYIMTPRGTYELKRLFSVRIPNRFGNDESAQAIKHRIASLVEQEDTNSPLSDQQINEQLLRGGASLSRRTVAKYRAQLGIPAHNIRKRIKINQPKGEVV
ncbi:MAG: RNA polymerase sigma-54 factor, partial [Gammaproteobacteria bacterium]|nr:RNA polymerase sigma-54 factor [Gammaproteobacteria bacterium]